MNLKKVMPFFNSTPKTTVSEETILRLFNNEFQNFSLRLLYTRIFRDSLLLNFTGKEHFELGLFGTAKKKDDVEIYSVLEIAVNSAMGGASQTKYYPVGTLDKLTSPLPKYLKGAFCGFIQQAHLDSQREPIIPNFNLNWGVGLTPLLALNNQFLTAMQNLMGAFQSPLFKVDPAQMVGDFSTVKKEIRLEISDIIKSWSLSDRMSAGLLPSGTSIDFPQINFESFDYIQTIIAQEISKITGFTITYLLGRQAQGLNATGEKDALQNIKMLKVYGNQYCLPLIQCVALVLDLKLVDKTNLLNIKYSKTIEELDESFKYLEHLGTINLWVKDEKKREKIENEILGLFN